MMSGHSISRNWRHWVCGTFAIMGAIAILTELYFWITQKSDPNPTEILSNFVMAPMGIYYFANFAITGRIPGSKITQDK